MQIPNHVAIIMDGNGRWAKRKLLPRYLGHREGVKTLKRVVKLCKAHEIKYLTVYAFSTENWQRPVEEVSFLMNLMKKTFDAEIGELREEGVRVKMLGDYQSLAPGYQHIWDSADHNTKDNSTLYLNVAFNYGGRNEITNAVRSLVDRVLANEILPEQISESVFAQHLYSHDIPDPDLVIRTGGEQRISNFLLWQAAYAEWYFTDVLWPDFDEEQFELALQGFSCRERRFGQVSD